MPAKGWRKDEQESNFDTVLLNENLSIDNFLFPKATINKICKQALAEESDTNFLLAKDTQTVIQRSSILFVNFIYHHAKQIVKLQNRKVVNAEDIITALTQVGFSNFTNYLNEELVKFNNKKEAKKLARAKLKLDSKKNDNLEDADIDDQTNNNNNNTNDSNKRLKTIDLDDTTMSDADNSISKSHVSSNNNNNNTEDENNDDDSADHIDALEDADDDDDEPVEGEGEEDETEDPKIRAPSQLELEERELVGDVDKDKVNASDDENDENDDNDE